MYLSNFQGIYDELGTLSSYLEFGHENLLKFEQSFKEDLSQSIERIRQSEGISDDTTDDEIFFMADRATSTREFMLAEEHEKYENNPWLHILGLQDGIETSDEYSQMFYATFITMLYSCIEKNLNLLCNIQELNIYKARDLLYDGFGFRVDTTDWKELRAFGWLRNAIVHSGLSLPLDHLKAKEIGDWSYGTDLIVIAKPPALLEYMKSKNIYIEGGLILLNLDYCKSIIKFSENFFLKIGRWVRTSEQQKNN